MRRYFWPRNAHNREQNRPPTPLAERHQRGRPERRLLLPGETKRARGGPSRRSQAMLTARAVPLLHATHGTDRSIDGRVRTTGAAAKSCRMTKRPHHVASPAVLYATAAGHWSAERMDTSPYATTPTEEALARKQDNGTARSCSALDGGPRASKREDGRMASTHVARVRTLAPILAARHYCTVVFQEKKGKKIA